MFKICYKKDKATVSPNGKIRFKKFDYQVIDGNFYGRTKSIKVKVSMFENKLYIFEPSNDGIYLGEAMIQKNLNELKKEKKAYLQKISSNNF